MKNPSSSSPRQPGPGTPPSPSVAETVGSRPPLIIPELDRHLVIWLTRLNDRVLRVNQDARYLSHDKVQQSANRIDGEHSWTVAAGQALLRFYTSQAGNLAEEASRSLQEIIKCANDVILTRSARMKLFDANKAANDFVKAIDAATPFALRDNNNNKQSHEEMVRSDKEVEQYMIQWRQSQHFQEKDKAKGVSHSWSATARSARSKKTLYPSVLIDLSESRFRKVSLGVIRDTFDKAVARHDETKLIKLKGQMYAAKDSDKVRLLFETEDDAETIQEHQEWLQEFPEVRICTGAWYPLKATRVRRRFLLNDPRQDQTLEKIRRSTSDKYSVSVERVRWLGKYAGEQYGSIVMFFTRKKDRDRIRDLQVIEIDEETAFVEEYEKRDHCSRCLGYGHRTRDCYKQRKCYLCFLPGHIAKNCKAQAIESFDAGQWPGFYGT